MSGEEERLYWMKKRNFMEWFWWWILNWICLIIPLCIYFVSSGLCYDLTFARKLPTIFLIPSRRMSFYASAQPPRGWHQVQKPSNLSKFNEFKSLRAYFIPRKWLSTIFPCHETHKSTYALNESNTEEEKMFKSINLKLWIRPLTNFGIVAGAGGSIWSVMLEQSGRVLPE